MRLGHIELFVTDPMVARHFYERILGCEIIEAMSNQESVWVKMGEVEILLRRGRSQQPAARYREAHAAIVLYTDDLPGTMSDLRARGLVFTGTDGSDREPTFVDPDGHWFQLVDPRDFS